MRVGILGSGDVGRKLGEGFIKLGHTVKIGTRNTGEEKIQAWIKHNGRNASAGELS